MFLLHIVNDELRTDQYDYICTIKKKKGDE